MREESSIAVRVQRVLTTAGIDFEVIPCEPDLADTATFCAHYGVDPQDAANCIVVAGKGDPRRHCAAVVLATTRLDVNDRVCALMGVRRASFASADETRELTGMLIGGVTPFALPAGLPLYVDEAVMTRARIVVGGGDRSSKLRLAPEALTRLGGQVISGLARRPGPPNSANL